MKDQIIYVLKIIIEIICYFKFDEMMKEMEMSSDEDDVSFVILHVYISYYLIIMKYWGFPCTNHDA